VEVEREQLVQLGKLIGIDVATPAPASPPPSS